MTSLFNQIYDQMLSHEKKYYKEEEKDILLYYKLQEMIDNKLNNAPRLSAPFPTKPFLRRTMKRKVFV